MRIVVARRLGKWGEGFGNEAISWSKGFLASQVLKARLVGPSWGLNRRRYYRNFRTSRLDFVVEEVLRRLPHYTFTEADYRATGEVDFAAAIEFWAKNRGLMNKTQFIVTVDGLYGGYPSIERAKPFLWQKLLSSRDALRNIYEVQSRNDPRKLFVAVHMRLGSGFQPSDSVENARGKFNISVPAAWYFAACQALNEAFGDAVQFHIFTDKRETEFREAVQRFNPQQEEPHGLTEASDLALMAMADFRICSVSSYSLLASFLSGGPYLWYQPQLTPEKDFYTLWGFETSQKAPGSLTQRAIAAHSAGPSPRIIGWPFQDTGPLPQALIDDLSDRLAQKQIFGNLLKYGAVPSHRSDQRRRSSCILSKQTIRK